MSKAIGVLLACLFLTSCGPGQFRPGPHLTQVPGNELPEPDPRDLSGQSRPYFIGPFDELKVDVFGVPALSEQEIQVDSSGQMAFPLVGSLQVVGKTPAELAKTLEEGLRGQFVRNPQVTVNLKRTVSQVVTVEGEVTQPGLYPVVGRMSLMRAIATAKGTTEFSDTGDVVIFRSVDGKSFAALYNLRDIRNGKYPDPDVFANDIVSVGDSRGRRLFKDILQTLPILTTPLVVALN